MRQHFLLGEKDSRALAQQPFLGNATFCIFLAVLEKKYVVLTLAVYLSVQKENDLLGDQKEWKSLKREVTKSGSGAGKKPEEWVGSRGEVAN